MSKSGTHSKQDWHREDIKAAIRKEGITVSDLARAHGYDHPSTFANVFRMPYPKVERIIAEFLGKKPEEIWPSRYKDKPVPKFNTASESTHRQVVESHRQSPVEDSDSSLAPASDAA